MQQEMDITVSQINNHLNGLINLKEQFSTLSKQSVEKFGKIIETAKVYQTKMDPLNKDMVQLQHLQKNIDACLGKLNQIELHRKTARAVESTIEEGPSMSMEEYLAVMERLNEAFEFFRNYDVEDVELTRLQSLYALGLKNLINEFGALLKETFRPINVELLLSIVRQIENRPSQNTSDKSSAMIEEAPEQLLNSLQFLIQWMKESQKWNIAGGLRGTDGARTCVNRYHDYRRQVLRNTLIRLRHFLKEQEAQEAPVTSRIKSGVPSGNRRLRLRRTPGFIWDVNARRQLNDAETEELHSEHHAISLAALVNLMLNERQWLERLQLVTSEGELQQSLNIIVKGAANELLDETHTLIKLMKSATKRAEYHMVLSLLLVLKQLSQIGVELGDALQGVSHVLFSFNSATYNLLHECSFSLSNYVKFLALLPEHGSGARTVVPPDGTVHELTTNAFMFFENLLEFSEVLSAVLNVGDIGPNGSSNAVEFLCAAVQDIKRLKPSVGKFMLDSIRALIENLNRKSESYSEEAIQIIFQMNNLQYILKAIDKTDIKWFISNYDADGVASIKSLLAERRGAYSRTCAFSIQLPNANNLNRFGVPGQRSMDTKERAAMKALWSELNSGFNSLMRQHTSISIPDRDLREELQRQLVADLVPAYRQFWDRCFNIPFTTHREKYMRFTVDEFSARVKQLLVS